MKKIKELGLIVLLGLLPTLLIWLPFFVRLKSFWGIPLPQGGMATIVSNYDGPLFLVVAKTFYDKIAIGQSFQFPLPSEYYAAHFPLFPALIRAFSPFGGYPYSMLFVTIASSILALYFFNKLIKQYVGRKEALLLTSFFAIFPARWLIVRSVGSAEPLFIAATIASIYYFQRNKFLHAGIWGMIAQLTKSTGILLFVAYFAYLIFPQLKKLATNRTAKWFQVFNIRKTLPVLLIPISLIAVFAFYGFRMGDFWAYFRSGDNIHLFFPPFQIFNYSAPWVGTFWLEEIIFIYLFGILGLIKLIKQKAGILVWYVGIFFVSTLFVSHRDLMRYSLPLVPFLFVAFNEAITKKEFKIAFVFIVIPIYLFSLAYISQNVMPISNWSPFL
ncbi:MAG: hypothetical protein Q8P91_00600 [bacterium]|nr:hypothetical protein [bacterium]